MANLSKTSLFNLGPLFLVGSPVDKMLKLRRREYIYKRNVEGGLVSHFSRLSDPEEEKDHLPVIMWQL